MSILHLLLLLGLCFALLVALLLLLSLCDVFKCDSELKSVNSEVELDEEGTQLFPENNNVQLVRQAQRNGSVPSQNGGIPSNPSATTLNERHLLPRATSRQSIISQNKTEEIRAIQNGLLRNGLVHSEKNDELEFNLIIGVDAQPSNFGGFFVDFQEEKRVEFYSIQSEDLPWRIFSGSADGGKEIAAKNLLFALMLWHEEILTGRKVLIFTGGSLGGGGGSGFGNDDKHGRRASKLLEHYAQCEGIVFGNDCRFVVDSKKDPKSYAEHVLPAEDLSSGGLRAFHDFVSEYYQVELDNFAGTHYIPPFKTRNEEEIGFEKTDNYAKYVEKVRNAMRDWTEPCPKCGYVDDETASMLSINRIPE